ncbi:MAG: hypothetical protein HN389_04255 [Clostridia bacterium]|jgi:hypothetical protein|nr:hypothetical protein [Clostridia bacterium]
MVEFNKPSRNWQEVSDLIYNMFIAEHYALEEGTKIDGIYGIGNAAGRFWGGGFVTRNKFSIKIFTTPDDGTLIHFDKAMSGMGGGIMGMAKMNKEFDRVKLILQNL